MAVRKIGYCIITVLLLSHCASKHQPIEFPSYFASKPDSSFSREQQIEIKKLESLPTPSTLEQRKLFSLYLNELSSVKPDSDLATAIKQKADLLKTSLKSEEEEISKAIDELNQKTTEPDTYINPAFSFSTTYIRRSYSQAIQAWNKDNSAAALKQIDQMLSNTSKALTDNDRYKFEGLRFRILLESGDLNASNQSYLMLQKKEPCSGETDQAAFLLSLLQFVNREYKAAHDTLTSQCEPKNIDPGNTRKKYWLARFSEGSGSTATAQYRALANAPILGFYGLMAQIRLGGKLTLPTNLSTQSAYIKDPFKVPDKIHQLLLKAEERLRVNLRKDASVYLTIASRLLRKEEDKKYYIPLLYIAHLCHAAGNHLEAMRIYSQITSDWQQSIEGQFLISRQLLEEMYPSPFQDRVEWLGRLWNVDSNFIYSIMRQESAFNPTATSTADARGLMQLMPWLGRLLAKQWGAKKTYIDKMLYFSDENLKFGTYYLHQVQNSVPHIALVAAGYNAGVNRAMNWWRRYNNFPLDVFIEMIPINETRSYVKLVIRNYLYYQMLRSNNPVDSTIIPFQLGPLPTDLASLGPLEASSIP